MPGVSRRALQGEVLGGAVGVPSEELGETWGSQGKGWGSREVPGEVRGGAGEAPGVRVPGCSSWGVSLSWAVVPGCLRGPGPWGLSCPRAVPSSLIMAFAFEITPPASPQNHFH